MLPNKRLQIFISSTYKDLIEERQAAVQAILSCNHIPAGMELFAASDQTQMNVIKDWINQSDIYLLILGGCYGSIEPISGKSYVQLEYEYALKLGKSTFAIVITDEHLEEKAKQQGTFVIEKDNQVQYKEFKKLVLSRMVRFWNDLKDIKLSIFETVSEFSRRHDLIGWVPGNQQVDTSKMAEELARLGQENSRLIEEKKEIEKNSRKINFKNLGDKRRGFTQRAIVNGHELIIRTGEYTDGNLGEILATFEAKENATNRALLECFSMAVSLGLQYGVPLDEFVAKFVFTKFEPSGFVEHPNIKSTTSVIDFIFRVLGYEYLGRTDLVHVLDKPELMNTGIDDWDEIPTGLEYEKEPELSSVRIVGHNDKKSKEKDDKK
jgi:Domain of unknown function (DUF4062)